MESQSVIGTWRVVTYKTKAANGRVTQPFGSRPQGYLMYTAEGLMTVAIMPEWKSQPALQRDEIANPNSVFAWLSWRRLRRLARFLRASTRYISYSGHYTVTDGKIINRVDVSNMPGLIHTNQEREYRLQDGCLTLMVKTASVSQCFTWERVGGDELSDGA